MKHYHPLLLNNTLFLQKLYITLNHKNYHNIISLTQNQSFPLINHLTTFILLSQKNNLYHKKHTQTTKYLNISYQHLLYILTQFIHNNLLTKNKKKYLIKNKKQLSKLTLKINPKNKFSKMIQ